MENVYTQNGYKDRQDYLINLAEGFGISMEEINTIADMLGPNEDFDGLVTSLEDYCMYLQGLASINKTGPAWGRN